MSDRRQNRQRTVEDLLAGGVVAVIRGRGVEEAVQMARACFAGGVTALEIALTTPDGLAAIRQAIAELGPRGALVGVGTVLDADTARAAIDVGARYVVTPALDVPTVRLCNQAQVPVFAGAMTVREILDGLKAGADLIKLFPGECLGPAFLRAVRGPLPDAPMMPTGGVSVANVGEWIAAGALAVGVGGNLTAPGLTGDWAEVTRRAGALVDAVRRARAARTP